MNLLILPKFRKFDESGIFPHLSIRGRGGEEGEVVPCFKSASLKMSQFLLALCPTLYITLRVTITAHPILFLSQPCLGLVNPLLHLLSFPVCCGLSSFITPFVEGASDQIVRALRSSACLPGMINPLF